MIIKNVRTTWQRFRHTPEARHTFCHTYSTTPSNILPFAPGLSGDMRLQPEVQNPQPAA